MARLPLHDPAEESSPETRAVLDGAEELLGFISNFALTVLLHTPELAKWLLPMFAAIQRGGSDAILDPRIKELAIVKVSTLNECAY